MAGNYPDVPVPRMAYDRDGTAVLTYNASVSSVTEHSSATKQELNDEDQVSVNIAPPIADTGDANPYFYENVESRPAGSSEKLPPIHN